MGLENKLTEIYNNKFTFFLVENKTRSKVVCKCNKCGTEYIRGYNYLKNGCFICECEKEQKWTDDKIISFLTKKYDSFSFKVHRNIDNNGDADILCVCHKCGNTFKMKFRTLRFYNVLCKKCEFTVHNKLEEKYVIDYIRKKGYDIISGSYVNEDSEFVLKCRDCGEEITTTYKRLRQQKKGCRNCQYNVLRKNEDNFLEELNKRYNGDIVALENYVNSYTPIRFKCNVCGNMWKASPDSILNKGIGCHICNKGVSYPNKLMKNILMLFSQDVIIEEEKALKKINSSWNGNHRFDFLVTKNNRQTVIEMDGGFHNREDIKEIDKKKDNFAESNNINVIRINCEYKGINSRFSTIKKAILDSKIRELINIDRISDTKWRELDEKSKKSAYKEIYEFYLLNSNMTFKDIGKVFNKRGDTISKIIKNFNKNYE